MKSSVAVTYEIDDPIAAASELAEEILGSMRLMKNSIGILFLDPNTDAKAIIEGLRERLDFDIVGCTAMATVGRDGFMSLSNMLTVLTADDCEFSAAISDPLTESEYREAIVDAYLSAKKGLEDSDRLILTYLPLKNEFPADEVARLLDPLSGGVPIFGGISSDDFKLERNTCFFNGTVSPDRAVFLLISGNIRPKFAIRHELADFSVKMRRVTKAEGNMVYTVGDERFYDYLESFGVNMTADNVLVSFIANPLMIDIDGVPGSNGVPIIRHLRALDREAGSGEFAGKVPEGAYVTMCLMKTENILNSAKATMGDILDRYDEGEEGYEYSTLFCTTCAGRFLILARNKSGEGEVLSSMLPDGLSFSGFYACGEYIPTSFSGGFAENRFHNGSVGLCLF